MSKTPLRIRWKKQGSCDRSQLILTVPTMFGCNRQKYGYSPAFVNVYSNVAAGVIMPESNL